MPQANTSSAVPSHALSMEDSGMLFDASPPPRNSNKLPPLGELHGCSAKRLLANFIMCTH